MRCVVTLETSATGGYGECRATGFNNNNNNNNNHDNIYSAVIYGTSHMRVFTVVPLVQSQSAPGGRQLVGQAANLTFESVFGWGVKLYSLTRRLL